MSYQYKVKTINSISLTCPQNEQPIYRVAVSVNGFFTNGTEHFIVVYCFLNNS